MNAYRSFRAWLQGVRSRQRRIIMVALVLILGTVLTLHAEIYKWQDETGTIRYSNVPPDTSITSVDTIPTQKIPLVEDTNGTVYYLNVPLEQAIEKPGQVPGPITLPPEVIEELFQEDVPAPPETSGTPPIDMAAVTLRLEEIEHALQQEIGKRQAREQEYFVSKSRVQELEQENLALKQALADLELKIEDAQATAGVADMPTVSSRETLPGENEELLDSLAQRVQALEATTGQSPDLPQAAELLALTQQQAQQLAEQHTQLAALHEEITALKTAEQADATAQSSEEGDASAERDEDLLPLLLELVEHNSMLESMLQQQAAVFQTQQQELDSLKQQLQHVQQSVLDPSGPQAQEVLTDEGASQRTSGGRIIVVEKAGRQSRAQSYILKSLHNALTETP